MKLVVVTAERDRPEEHALIERMFALGLDRLHVRKPHASRDDLAHWLEHMPPQWRARLVLHQHHELATEFCVGGLHWRDCAAVGGASRPDSPSAQSTTGAEGRPVGFELARNVASKPSTYVPSEPVHRSSLERRVKDNAPYLTSRSCHDLAAIGASIGQFDSVFFGPVFASISKRGYVPDSRVLDSVSAFLRGRMAAQKRTEVIAIGGVTPQRVARAVELGFDGVAALGAIWEAPDPVEAFEQLLSACRAGSPDPADLFAGDANGRMRRSRPASISA